MSWSRETSDETALYSIIEIIEQLSVTLLVDSNKKTEAIKDHILF